MQAVFSYLFIAKTKEFGVMTWVSHKPREGIQMILKQFFQTLINSQVSKIWYYRQLVAENFVGMTNVNVAFCYFKI